MQSGSLERRQREGTNDGDAGSGRHPLDTVRERLMGLTPQQLTFYDTFGFLKFPGAFSEEVDSIIDTFEQLWANHGGGHHGNPHDFQRRSALVPFIDRSEYLSSLIDDPRIDAVAGEVLGEDYNYTGSDGNFYVGDTSWHSDQYRARKRKYRSFKMALYLDPVTRDTGCLRVIPGSHAMGDGYADALHESLQGSQKDHSEETWGVQGRDLPSYPLESEPGDLLMFNHSTKHASYGGGVRRRMFTLNFQERYRDEDLADLREDISGKARFWLDKVYGDAMLRTATPSRMRHLEQRLASADHLPELARKARDQMEEPSRG